MVKKEKRSYERRKIHELEKANVEDPVSWQTPQRMRPSKTSSIPWEVEDEEVHVYTGHEIVLNHWMTDFQGLFTTTEGLSPEQAAFLDSIKQDNEDLDGRK